MWWLNFLLSVDGVDGKQARRTNSSTPLGELFDHGLDSWACIFFVATVYSVFGRGESGVGVATLYYILWVVLFSFILSHWEKYNTGILFLPWGYDMSQVVRMHTNMTFTTILSLYYHGLWLKFVVYMIVTWIYLKLKLYIQAKTMFLTASILSINKSTLVARNVGYFTDI